MRVMTVVGARPEFVQCTILSKMIRERHTEILVHTGQHYDKNMSEVFFSELDLPMPDVRLGIGSGDHGLQTGTMMIRLENLLCEQKPDCVVVYGDTNSTLAAALTAVKLHIPVAHIEAGLRSFDRAMPEEINRVVTDHISTLLFAPTTVAVRNLAQEGITKGVHLVGDVRVDILYELSHTIKDRKEELLRSFGLSTGSKFALATIHRASNTDDPIRLRQIVRALSSLDIPIILPIHPRLAKMLGEYGMSFGKSVLTIEPVGYLDMLTLLDACAIVITDSGGLQKEAYLTKRQTVTLRNTTEWIETVDAGWNSLCEPDVAALKAVVNRALRTTPPTHPDFYGTPGVNQRICATLENFVQIGVPEIVH